MSCHHECNDHDHHEGDVETGHEYSLFQKINLDQVECLNEAQFGSAKTVFKAWDNRLDKSAYVESDCDEELLISIPFTGLVKLKGVVLIGGESGSHPRYMKLFKNNPGMTFDDVQGEPTQMFEVTRDETGSVEYSTKVAKFASIHHLTIFIPENYGAELTRIYYIGLRGEFMGSFKDRAVIATYESRAMPQDHKGFLEENMHHEIK